MNSNFKFECNSCGKCCRELSLKNKLMRMGYWFHFGGSEATACLPLFEWEIQTYKEEAEKLGLEISIKPHLGVVDLKNKRKLIIQWGLMQEPCPFLKENLCQIYEKRALSCREFPISKTPVIQGNDLMVNPHCPLIPRGYLMAGDMTLKEGIKRMYEQFGETFISAVREEIILKQIFFYLTILQNQQQVKLAFNERQDKLKKKTEEWEEISAIEFLKEQGIDFEGEIERAIKPIIEVIE